MSAKPMNGRPITRKQRQEAARRARKRKADAMRAAAAEASERAEEARAEGIAPAIQRHDVVGPGGVVRVARVEADGKAFKVANPVARLAKVSRVITEDHAAAAARLVIAWEEGGRGVGLGASLYGERTSGGASAGMIGDRTLAALRRQNAARDEFVGAQRWLGRLWAPIVAIVLNGTDVSAWAAATKRNRDGAVGYLAAALDRLVEFYEALDKAREQRKAG